MTDLEKKLESVKKQIAQKTAELKELRKFEKSVWFAVSMERKVLGKQPENLADKPQEQGGGQEQK